MPLPPESRYRLHLLTIFAIAIVIGALVYRQFEYEKLLTWGNLGVLQSWGFVGWPWANAICSWTSFSIGGPPTTTLNHDWRIGGIAGNVLFAVAMIAAVESHLRTRRGWQVSLQSLLWLPVICGLLLVLTRESEFTHPNVGDFTYPWSLLSFTDLRHPQRWPLWFGVAAMLVAAGKILQWLFFRLTLVPVRWNRWILGASQNKSTS